MGLTEVSVKQIEKRLQIYTDGACSGNPGAGGWAAVLLFGSAKKEISGFEAQTTNNRMELLAAIKGLEAIKWTAENLGGCKVELYSDSAYLVNAVTKGWLDGWQKNNWRTADKSEVKNKDLWLAIIELNKKLSPAYIKVKGHSDNQYNNRADELAVAEIKQRKDIK